MLHIPGPWAPGYHLVPWSDVCRPLVADSAHILFYHRSSRCSWPICMAVRACWGSGGAEIAPSPVRRRPPIPRMMTLVILPCLLNERSPLIRAFPTPPSRQTTTNNHHYTRTERARSRCILMRASTNLASSTDPLALTPGRWRGGPESRTAACYSR